MPVVHNRLSFAAIAVGHSPQIEVSDENEQPSDF